MPSDMMLHAANFSTLFVCMVLKFPQIFVLMRAKSTAGVSLNSLLLELIGYIVFVTYQMYYDYPPPTYLEYPILIAQDAILLLLILHYNGSLRHSLIYTLLFVGGWRLLTVEKWIIDLAMYDYAQEIMSSSDFRKTQVKIITSSEEFLMFFTCLEEWRGWSTITEGSQKSLCTFISAASKLAQLQCLWRSKDAGQVSALSWALATYTCMARIYTTTVTTGDMQVMVRFIAMTLLNMWVLLTVLYYQRHSSRSKKED